MTLRRRILLLSVGSTALVLALFAIPLTVLLHAEASDAVSASATDAAHAAADYLSSGPSRASITAYVKRVNDRDDSYPVAVLLDDGSVVGASLPGVKGVRDEHPSSPQGDPDDRSDSGHLVPTSPATVTSTSGGRLVTVEVHGTDGDDRVVVYAANSRVTTHEAEQLALLGAVGLVLLLLTAAASHVVTRRLVATLAEAADAADALGEGVAGIDVPETGPPEVVRVAAALNRLATRIDELLVAEREVVADLSHRLRTPLTALRLDLESLARTTQVEDLERHLDSLERTLTEVIREARRSEREGVRPHADPGIVVREAFEYWSPLAEDQGRDARLELTPGLGSVRCAAEDLRVALDALIGNSIAHTEDGVPITVVAGPHPGGGVLVEVRDRGAGVRPEVVRRGRSDRGSSGLGLDIARRCAEASGGRLELDRLVVGHSPDGDGAGDAWSVVRLVLGPS